MQPVLDEARLIDRGASLQTQPGLKCCERASDPKPGLADDYADCSQMQKAEGEGVDPTPAQDVAADNKNEPTNHKVHDRKVEQEHEIGKNFEHGEVGVVKPNVRAKRATTAGRQARAGENVPRTASPGLVACRWRSA